jgi:hypothetical protein
MAESEDKGYTVKDRRYLHLSEEEKAKIREEEASQKAVPEAQEAAGEAGAAPGEVPLPELTFSTFIFSLGSSAFTHLGAIPDPQTGQTQKDLILAKQTIDLLGLLREKTRNNLTAEEENLFDSLLYDLRMTYVQERG